MAVTIEATYEGQTDGVGLTTANSDDFGDRIVDALVGTAGNIKYDNDHPAGGSMGLLFPNLSTASNYIRYDVENGFTSCAVRFYIWYTGVPSTAVNFPSRIFNTAAGNMIQVLSTTTGQLRLQSSDGATTLATTTWTPTLNTLYRIEYQLSGLGTASTAGALQVFAGHSTTPETGSSISFSGVTTTGTGRYLGIGKSSTATVAAYWIDEVKASSGTNTAIGPIATTTDIPVVDATTFTESPANLAVDLVVSDSATLTETSTETTSGDGVDDGVLSEGTTILAVGVAVVDLGSETDASSLSAGSGVADSAGLSAETAGIVATGAISDSAALSDVSSLVVSLAVSDSATESEGTTGSVQSFAVVDTGTQSEGTTVHTAATSATDSWIMTDVSGLNSGGVISGSDSTTMTETSGISADASIADSATLTDISALDRSALVVDSATLTDVSALLQTIAVVDSATLTDASSLSRSAALVDSATMTDTAVLTVLISVNDSAGQTEDLISQLSTLANDASFLSGMAGVEEIVLLESSDGATLVTEVSFLFAEDEDTSEFTRIKVYFPKHYPVTQITFNGS